MGAGKFGLFEQPIDRTGAIALNIVGRDPSNIGIVEHSRVLANDDVLRINTGKIGPSICAAAVSGRSARR